MRTRVATGILLVLALTAGARSSSGQSVHRTNGELAFEAQASDFALSSTYVMASTGKGLKRILRNAGEPAWAPQGRRLAFNVAGNVVVTDANGGRRKTIADGIDPRWSPDGKRIVFDTERHGKDVIGVVGIADGRRPKIFHLALPAQYPDWSPDGSRIAFDAGERPDARGLTQDPDVYVMRADGTHVRRLTSSPGPYLAAAGPRWSPDGQRILYECEGRVRGGLCVVSATGSNPRFAVRDETDDSATAGSGPGYTWSPDGTEIAECNPRQGVGIVVFNLVRQRRRVIHIGKLLCTGVDWQALP
jgi:Tol biopolymer transport system component